MPAAFYDDAVVDDGDDVRVDNGGKSVRDQNRSSPLPRLVQRILHDLNRFFQFLFPRGFLCPKQGKSDTKYFINLFSCYEMDLNSFVRAVLIRMPVAVTRASVFKPNFGKNKKTFLNPAIIMVSW